MARGIGGIVVFAWCAVIVVTACGLDVVGIPVSANIDGDGGGGVGTGSAPPGSPPTSPPSGDAGIDGDAAPVDAGVDATPVNHCATTPPEVFDCWDFETAATSIGTFDPIASDGTASVAVAGGSNVLDVKLATGPSGRSAWVRKAIGPFGLGATTYEMRFRFAIPQASIEYAAIGGFQDQGGSIFGVAAYKAPGSTLDLKVVSSLGPGKVNVTPGPTWHDAIVTITQGTIREDASITIDGTSIYNSVWDVPPLDVFDAYVGAYYTAGPGTGSYDVIFDDIEVRRR